MPLLTMAAMAYAQTFSEPTELYSPLDAVGTPAGTYALSGIEWVNYLNGNLVVQVPLGTARGRGSASFGPSVPLLTGAWSVAYLSNGSSGSYSPLSITSNAFDGWDYTGGFVEVATVSANTNLCLITSKDEYVRLGPYVTKITWTASNLTQVTLVDSSYNGEPEESATTPSCSQLNSGYQGVNRGQVFRSTDGSNLTFVASAAIYDNPLAGGTIAGTLYFPDGTHYIWTSPSVGPEIEDRNGNTLAYSFQSTTNGGKYTLAGVANQSPTFTFTENPPSQSYDTLTFPGYNSATRTVTVNYTLLANALSTGSIGTYATLFPELNGSSSTQYNPYVVSSIVLNDGHTYAFLYDPYGEVTKITLPTGGAYEYSYGAGCSTAVSPNTCYSDGVIKLPNQAGTNQEYVIYRRVTERDELSNGTTISAKTLFSAAPSGNIDPNNPNTAGTTVTVTFENSSGNTQKKETHLFYGDPSQQYPTTLDSNLYPAWVEGLEFQSNILNAGGTLLQKQQKVFGQRPWGSPDNTSYPWFTVGSLSSPQHDPQLCQTNVTNDASQVSGIVLGYDAYNNVNVKAEYGYGSAPAISASCPAVSSGYTRKTTAVYQSTASYIAPAVNLVRLPNTSTVYNGSGGQAGLDQWTYDGTAVTSATGLLAHDDTDYGTGNNVRGNLTQHQSWWSIPNSNISENFTYDMVGAALSYKDFNGNSTTYTYTDAAHVSPNTIVNPLGATNGTTTLVYDQGNLKPTKATDANSFYTTFAYSDPLDRLTQAVRGSGASQTNYSYPSPTQVTVKQDQVSAGDGAIRVDTLYDDLGRPIQTNQYESTTGYIDTTTTYDALGRVSATTSPSRPGDGLNYTTNYAYDALSRLLSVTTVDNSVSSTSYSGNATTATDPSGHARTSTFDALGRLTQVVEDPGSSPHLNYTTTYAYDALDNLNGVTQGSQSRTLAYDSLSRLAYAINPESGTINYDYDNNGNLVWQNNNGREICYHPDVVNRITLQVYYTGTVSAGQTGNCSAIPSGDYDTTTPNVTLTYDTGATNAKGRLVSVANSNATQSLAGYDAMGRITGSTQASSGQNYTFSYTYNLADSLTSTTYPSGRVVTNSYDGANRTSKVYAGSKNYVSSVTYAPHGAYAGFTFGNSMARTNSYNNRLQPSEMKDVQSGQSTAAIDLLYYWNYTSPATSSTTNNGNLTNVQVNTQALGMLASNYYQTFAYDNVNRLTTAGDNGGYGWSQNFGYDQFGNMWLSSFAGIVTPNLTPSLQSKINAATNHVSLASGTAYDGNGNLTTYGSSTLSYDTNNMMIGVAGSATYAYDGLGQRVSKAYGGVTTVYTYDAFGNPAAEYSSAATSLPVCATCYLSWDQLGSTRLVTDQNATPVARHDFLPFGGEITGAYASRPSLWGTSDNVDPKFTGQFRDTESGLDFFNSRYHAQAMGRLLSADPGQAGADPANPQSWNGYAYTINSPLVFTDPDGMDPFDGGGDTGDPCIDDPFLCNSGGYGLGWPTQPIPPPQPPLPPIVSSSGVPNTTGVYGQGQYGNGFLPAASIALPCIGPQLGPCITVGGGALVLYLFARALEEAIAEGYRPRTRFFISPREAWEPVPSTITLRGKTADPHTLPQVNPGRDANGNCLPCPEEPPAWEAEGNAHGSTTGTHWHWLKYNQNSVTCECFPARGSSPTKP
jgi:RHS repeat-associated protein